MKIFVDSGFFIALSDKSDDHFSEAQNYFLSNGQKALFTHNVIISETITYLRSHAGYKYAKEFGEKFRNSSIIQLLWIDQHLEEEAWKIFLKYSDKEFSYVDCLSFACMRTYKSTHALTFDRHFRQIGFSTLPGK